jgi:hypothetical protein
MRRFSPRILFEFTSPLAFDSGIEDKTMKLTKSLAMTLGACSMALLFTGCASVLCGPTQSVAINSRPPGAEVLVYDSQGEIVLEETTPCVAELKRRNQNFESAGYVVLVRKPGYEPVQVPLTGQLNRAYLANILFGGIGLIVDPLTGSMWTLSPDNVDSTLVNQHAAFFKEGLLICLEEEVPQDLVSHLKPLGN